MGKLDTVVDDAAKNNLASQAGREIKNKAKNEAKKKAKNEAKKAAKKAAKRAHKSLCKHSKLYARSSKAAARAAQIAAHAGRSLLTFLATPPVGWICSVILICILVGMSSGGSDDDSKKTEEQSIAEKQQQLLLLDDTCPVIDMKAPGSVGDSGDVGATDWTTHGTVAYDNAKSIFDHWVDKGFSGAGASGIIGWVASEGGFSMIGRAEGHYGTDLETNSVMYGVVPTPLNDSYDVGGGGVYQLTPFTKYAELNSPDWEDADKMNKFVGNAILAGSWNPDYDLTGDGNTLQAMAQQTNPQYATLIWNAYERGDIAHISKDQKQTDAQKAYDAFEGSTYTYNAEKFERAFGDTAESDTPSTPGKIKENKCGRKSGGEWRETGGQPTTTNGVWTPSEVPNDIKEFAMDPKSVGLGYRKSAGWNALASGSNNQCTDLSASLMYALWEKDGEHPKQLVGNGRDVVKNWVRAFGGVSNPKPKAGSVFSSYGLADIYGHTGVVSQVFDNGDFLIIEQNYTGKSGEVGNMTFSWNYRYITKSQLSRDHYTFFDPSIAGYKLVSTIKSL